MTVINRSAPVTSGAFASQIDLSYLKKSNPKLDDVLKQNPGVLKFLEKHAATGSLMEERPGDVQTQVRFGMWTHSARSGGMREEPFKETIIVWQEDPGSKSDVRFTNWEKYQGRIIGVFRLEQLEELADAADNRFNGPKRTVSSDNGWEWPDMKVRATGKAGTNLSIKWAIVNIDQNGNVQGGGFPGGWAGREYDGKHGTNDRLPVDP
jgi:hypothetical protein